MPDHRHGPGCVGIEIAGTYDGVLWWMCDDGRGRPRFTDPDDPLSAAASQWVEAYETRQQGQEPGQETPGEALAAREPADAQSLGPQSYRRVRGHYGPLGHDEGKGDDTRD